MKFRVKECCFNDICKYQIQYKNPKKKTIFNFWKYEEWLPYIENYKWFYDTIEEIEYKYESLLQKLIKESIEKIHYNYGIFLEQ